MKPKRSGTASFEPFSRDMRSSPSAQWLGDYAAVTGLSGSNGELPLTALQVLAGAMHVRMLAERSMPRSALGLVHMRNVFERLAPMPASASWRLEATVFPEHSSDGRLRGVRIETTAETGGQVCWRSTIDAVWPEPRKNTRSKAAPALEPAATPSELLECVRVASNTGRRYAGVSGDYNPIHLHAASARLFGFPRAIAHGMWTVARMLASVDTKKARLVEARFKKPLLLPADMQLFADASGARLWACSPDASRTYVEMDIVDEVGASG